MKQLIIVVLVLTIGKIKAGPVLDNLPITFEMIGNTTYSPDLGSSTVDGYLLKIGYTGHSWLAVEFPDTAKNDVLVVTANDFYTKLNDQYSGHQVLVNDYYYTSTDGLKADQDTAKDISSFNYTNEKAFYLTVTRYFGSNGGQDWNAPLYQYGVQKVCFYTSTNTFDATTWNQHLSMCYYFEIDKLVSKFVGLNLKSFTINGYSAKIYGWIDGPYLTDNIYIFQQSPLFTYTKQPAFILQLGETSGGQGQDFYVDSPIDSQTGDYYGASVSNIKKDSSTGGFQNNGLSANFWNAVPSNQITAYSNTALRIMFSRNISTYDDYDKVLLSTFIFCLRIYSQGTINSQVSDKSCEIVQLSYSYVKGVLQKSGYQLVTTLFVVFLIFILNL